MQILSFMSIGTTVIELCEKKLKNGQNVKTKKDIIITEIVQRKQARIVVCITEPLLCYMNSGCVLEYRDTHITLCSMVTF